MENRYNIDQTELPELLAMEPLLPLSDQLPPFPFTQCTQEFNTMNRYP